MYYPYFRGKQYELITIRENPELFSTRNIIPIIEPVRETFSPLQKALDSLVENDARFILIINPKYGFYQDNTSTIYESIANDYLPYEHFSTGFIINNSNDIGEIPEGNVSLIHYANRNTEEISSSIRRNNSNVIENIFIHDNTSTRYRRHFRESTRVLLKDGFKIMRNRDYPEQEPFSEYHLIYDSELGMDGFGDFLIVGDDYSETGGPAHAVVIHLTYLDADEENDMYIKHYRSERTMTPSDPAGKFLEALSKLVEDVNSRNTKILRTNAVREFCELFEREHYPGLGYVKKLSMQHHLELLYYYLHLVQ